MLRVVEIDQWCCCELSWTTTKAFVNMDTTNERGKHGRDLYFHVYVSAMVQAKRIPIKYERTNLA